jgi:hypothetical protein
MDYIPKLLELRVGILASGDAATTSAAAAAAARKALHHALGSERPAANAPQQPLRTFELSQLDTPFPASRAHPL